MGRFAFGASVPVLDGDISHRRAEMTQFRPHAVRGPTGLIPGRGGHIMPEGLRGPLHWIARHFEAVLKFAGKWNSIFRMAPFIQESLPAIRHPVA